MKSDILPGLVPGARRIVAAALFALLLLPGLAQPARAADCEDGDVVTGTGTVGDVFPNKAGTWTIGVAHGHARCLDSFIMVVSEDHPPPSCRTGARLTATFEVEDVLFGGLDFKRLITLDCE